MPSIWPSGLLVFIDVNRLVDSFSVSLSFSDLGRRRSKREIDRRGTWKSICCIRTNVYSSIRREERSHAVAKFLALFAGSRYLDVRTLGKDGRSRLRRSAAVCFSCTMERISRSFSQPVKVLLRYSVIKKIMNLKSFVNFDVFCVV